MVAYRVAWEITRNPAIRILYISSTANLAIKQIKFIKDILTHPTYKFYWPEMLHPDEGKREKWSEAEFSVDHPKRKEQIVRDPTVFTAGLTTSITGLHCDVAVLDDVVVRENAYTNDGREKVKQQYSLLSSIEGADSVEWVVGTRYHPRDLYNDLQAMQVEIFDDHGNIVSNDPLYEMFEKAVENRGDGTGEFLWPRQARYDGKWFGFDQSVLAKKRAQYLDRVQFRAQYYNNPNEVDTATINKSLFQYYDRGKLKRIDGKWYHNNVRLNLFASVDFAFSLKQKADFTAIVIVGVDHQKNYFVIDIDRFKTDRISEYFDHILRLYQKWDFRKLRAEVSVAQQVIVQDLKDNYIRTYGLALSIDEFRPSAHGGSKEERVEAILQPRYANHQIWHYQGGNCQVLEEELVLTNPPHDDVKDALASVIDMAVPPSSGAIWTPKRPQNNIFNNRFGGIS